MAFDWKGLVAAVAPTLASALGTPVSGLAISAILTALGVTAEPSEQNVSTALAKLTPEGIVKLKEADRTFAVKMKELDIDLEKIQVEDRESARQMQIATKSLVPAILAGVVTLGFFSVLGGMLAGMLHTHDTPELLLLVGSLSTAWGMVIQFYYGSSLGSQRKDDTIHSLSQ